MSRDGRRGIRRWEAFIPNRGDLSALVERFNLRRVYYWLFLATLVGLVGGLGALVFKWLADHIHVITWSTVRFAPPNAGGEPLPVPVDGSLRTWALVLAPAIGGLASALIVYRFAPSAAGHGTDAAIRAYHRDGGRISWSTPIVKLVASALTLGSGGSAGREGPIAQIGAGFGSVLGSLLRLSERERRVLMMAGLSAGIGAIFRAPFAGAIFAAEVLYREPDIESEVLVPALLASIVSYSLYCSVHGFGHLLTGTAGFSFDDPRSLAVYVVLGLVVAFGGILYITLLDRTTHLFQRLPISRYAKPAIGGLLVGAIGLAALTIMKDTGVLAVMGSGYGILQRAVSEWASVGPTLTVLAIVAFGKMVTTSLSIGSGGSGGVFGPSMVIGGCLGALVGTIAHAWFPDIAPNVGPFTIVGMAGFFAGVAKTPISTLLMVGELTGNYALLLPSMLVVCLSMIIAHRWTIYPEQVPTHADSPVHRRDVIRDALEKITIGSILEGRPKVSTVTPHATVRDVLILAEKTSQETIPILDASGRLVGVARTEVAESIVAENPAHGLVVAQDLIASGVPVLRADEPVARALEVLALPHLDEVPVIADDGTLVGVVDRQLVLQAYRRRVEAAGKHDED